MGVIHHHPGPYVLASLTMEGKSAISPSMLKTPSTTIKLGHTPWWLPRTRCRSFMSLWRYFFTCPNDRRTHRGCWHDRTDQGWRHLFSPEGRRSFHIGLIPGGKNQRGLLLEKARQFPFEFFMDSGCLQEPGAGRNRVRMFPQP